MKLMLVLLNLALITPALATPLNWRITKTSWSATDEKNYSNFVAAIGKAGCNTFNSCLRSPANPYRSSDPAEVNFFSDCADLPYMLRAYFSWKNGLPFSIVSEVASADASDGDIRYSPNGNVVKSRIDYINKPGPLFPNPVKSMVAIADIVSSAMYRFDPQLANDSIVIGTETLSRMVPDFYSVKVSRTSIKPGSIIYDPNGHVAVVYSVEPDGRVLFIDSHPDNSLTHGTYGKKFARSRPGMGAGFKNFRPLKLVGAQLDASGNYVGGKIYFAPDIKIADYDTTQFFGTLRSEKSWSQGQFVLGNQRLDYYDWTRMSLANGSLKFHPVEEMRNMMTALCQDIQERVNSIDVALKSGIAAKAEPTNLPNNIYGTDGDWESFSSPSRDARLKTSFKELRDQVQAMVQGYLNKDARIDYQGTNLKRDLLDAYDAQVAACLITYKRSDGSTRTLNFEDVRKRLYALSFDPYQCVERRWGATEAAEIATCKDDGVKTAWYIAEQRLRNQIDRVYDIKMGFSLDQLKAKVPGTGVDLPPDVDTLKYLNSLNF